MTSLAPKLAELLGQQVVVDNRAGANALIGADVVAKSPVDGYTLLFGHIDLMFSAISTILPYYKVGQVRGLGVTSPRRRPSIPEVPTIAETVPKYECRSWDGVLAPAGTPREIVTRLNAALVKLTNTPEMRSALIALGTDPETNTPEEFAQFIRDEVARSARVVKAAGVNPE